MVLGDLLAENSFPQGFKIMGELGLAFFVLFRQFSLQTVFDLFDLGVAVGLGMFLSVERVGQFLANLLFQGLVIGIVKFDGRRFAFGFTGAASQIRQGGAYLLDLQVGKIN